MYDHFSSRIPLRFFYSLFVLVIVICDLGFGQERGRFQEPVVAKVEVDDNKMDEDEMDASLTFDELKLIGARRSKYLDFKPQNFNRFGKQNAGADPPKPGLTVFRTEIQPILTKACVQCHGGQLEEGNIRIDNLNPNLVVGDDVDWWLEVAAVLTNGEMPPEDDDKLTDVERSKVIDWISSEVQLASALRRDQESHSSFRRMTRYEFNYVLQDLLGASIDFGKDLPPESASRDGFQNSSEMLQMSVVQFGAYRAAIRDALRKTTVEGDRPSPLYWGISMTDASAIVREKFEKQVEKIRLEFKGDPDRLDRELEKLAKRSRNKHSQTYFLDTDSGVTTRAAWSYGGARYALKPSASQPVLPTRSEHVAILPTRQKLIIELGDQIPEAGSLRVRILASRADLDGDESNIRLQSLQLEFGWQASNDSQASVKIGDVDAVVTAKPGKPQFYEWVIPISEIYPRNSVRKTSRLGDLPSPSEYIKLVNSSASQNDIRIEYVEVTAPFYEQWPPKSHTRIFGEEKKVASESQSAKTILERFMARAWRRGVSDGELSQKLRLFNTIRPECENFQEAMIEVMAVVLSSPKFLYLVQTGSNPTSKDLLDQHEFATRLSMFLWCSTPDDRLLKLASENRLGDFGVLRSEVQRMLADPKSKRFSKQFTRQWLGMQLLDFLNVDKKVFRQFDPLLKEAMKQEPIAFFHEVLSKNESVLEFLHADYVMVNERLARHYGMKGVYGNQLRRVEIEAGNRRGGVLTQAGLLAMNSDGKDSHPLKRGIWLLERLLNDPPPPPPPAVPEIDLADPEIAKLSLKEQIENHRNHAACMSCHAKIDPWGIAFENFDAVGAWRTEVNGKTVDASSKLFNKQQLDGVDGLKRFLLLDRQDQFIRAMVHKLATFGLGRPLTFGDRSKIDEITAKVRKADDGLATMVILIVTSDLFRSR